MPVPEKTRGEDLMPMPMGMGKIDSIGSGKESECSVIHFLQICSLFRSTQHTEIREDCGGGEK
jgi:hypothetical protein